MRTLGYRSSILFALAAAAGLVAALARPWYGPSPSSREPASNVGTMPSTIEEFFSGLWRSVREPDGVTGWAAFQTSDLLIAALAAIVAVMALATLVPVLQAAARSGAQCASLAALAVVAYALVDQPGGRDAVEARVGGWIALLSSGVMVVCAMHLAAAPRRRRRVVQPYCAPAAPRWEPADSVAPPPRQPVG